MCVYTKRMCVCMHAGFIVLLMVDVKARENGCFFLPIPCTVTMHILTLKVFYTHYKLPSFVLLDFIACTPPHPHPPHPTHLSPHNHPHTPNPTNNYRNNAKCTLSMDTGSVKQNLTSETPMTPHHLTLMCVWPWIESMTFQGLYSPLR